MTNARSKVLVTGIGLVSSLGEGVEAHLAVLGGPGAPQPVLETERFAPFVVHPLPAIDWAAQIPKKDQRQMETWQKLGVYAAGLALADSGLAADEATRSGVDMIVAAGGGERDLAVDALVLERTRGEAEPQATINAVLSTELRPTLFLAQLSNLLAGNISIVHKVTGSSRTFMGEEGAGISAVETAAARIAAGQSRICLVGGAFSAERKDLLLNFELGRILWHSPWRTVAARSEPGGLVPGTVGAFLVLESAESAAARGATSYAELVGVASDRGPRDDADAFSGRLDELLGTLGSAVDETIVLSGASGFARETATEHGAIGRALPGAPVRAYGNLIGHSFEAHFPAGLALGAAALSRGIAVVATDAGHEAAADTAPAAALVTGVGHLGGEGVALLRRVAGA